MVNELAPVVAPPGSGGLCEIDAFFRKSGKAIIALTVREILDEEIARKVA